MSCLLQLLIDSCGAKAVLRGDLRYRQVVSVHKRANSTPLTIAKFLRSAAFAAACALGWKGVTRLTPVAAR
jgi:hypothetical protein